VTGARFRMSLAWAVVLGVIGIVIFAEMAGRVATVSHRPVFDLVRERVGARLGLANLVASYFINFLTLAAEVAGVALALQLASDVNYLLWDTGGDVPRLVRDLADQVRDDGAGLSGWPASP